MLLLAFTASCTDANDMEADLDLASSEAEQVDKADGPATWDVAPTLHVGARAFDGAQQGGRRVHPVWIAGATSAPVTFDVEVAAAEGYDVRFAVLGPIKNGVRPVLAADGYASRKSIAKARVATKLSGEHLIVVGSYNLARETFYDVTARCANTACNAKVDILASPKAGALVAMQTNRLLQANLGAVLATRNFDVELELWVSPPGQSWNAVKVATSVASGNQVNAILPASVKAGDDIQLVVRKAGGAVLDSGVLTRFAPTATAFARTDAILLGDLVSVQIGGVVGFFEGVAEMSLRSVTHNREIATHTVRAELPGAVGNGFGAFDATFAPELFNAEGVVNPVLPRDGEKLSVGWIDGNGGYRRLGCFEYCNDLAGTGSCTGGPRACN
ncbi:MAG: hypothetical protein M4D80_36345 [Myxococcota bacterium]|nr:hypothetical protein [Deltaproteobacteria bacterium]MDQ3340661.1 hypothetical protein [Myxococcota bacterium]